MKTSKFFLALAVGVALASLPVVRADNAAAPQQKSDDITVTGEVLDMACYLGHGACGTGHAGCAEKCISSGLPVGLKGTDGKTYLLIGDHKPANEEFAPYA